MTHEEYEARKQQLDEQLQAGIELLKTAHRQQLRALDLVWMTTAEGNVAVPQLSVEAPQVRAPAPAPPPVPAAPPPPPHRTPGQLTGEVQKVLSLLPDPFDRNDVCQALGYEPDRGSLYRALQNLVQDERITVEFMGGGKVPSRYKRRGGGASKPAG